MNSLSEIAVIYSSDSDTETKVIIANPESECEFAASCGDLERLKRARKAGCKWNIFTTLTAARNGHLECLKYAHVNGCPWNIFTTNQSAEKGHIECLKYVHENGMKLHPDSCNSAAKNGHLNCLKYAHENGCVITSNIYNAIITSENKSIECFKYLYESGCPWNEKICRDIILYGNIDMLKYAHENCCPLGEYTCIQLFEKANIECIIYAYEHGCTWYEDYIRYTNTKIASNIGKNDDKLLSCWNKKNIENELRYNDWYYTPDRHIYVEENNKFYDPFVTELLDDMHYFLEDYFQELK